MWKIFRISGSSMAPTLLDGDFVLAVKHKKKPVTGSVVVIHHPQLGSIIKRILSTDGAGNISVSGDNLMSTAPNFIGPVDEIAIKYVGRWRISPFGISKLIPTNTEPPQITVEHKVLPALQ